MMHCNSHRSPVLSIFIWKILFHLNELTRSKTKAGIEMGAALGNENEGCSIDSLTTFIYKNA